MIAAFAVLSFFLLLRFAQFTEKKSASQNQVANTVSSGLPVRLKIPSINVNATIQPLGILPSGEMEVPNSSLDVGWFKLGPRPGEIGNAVIAGHFDGFDGKSAVFSDLNKLQKGDKLYIVNDNEKTISFVVREIRTYDPGYAESVFSSNDNAHLNLITCDGIWNNVNNSYTKRLVVFTDIVR